MRTLDFHCPFPAVGKARARSGRNGWYTPTKTAQFERNVAAYAREAIRKAYWSGHAPWTGPVELEVECVFPAPRSWPKRRTAQHMGRPHCAKPDGDNVLKSVKDALEAAGVYTDDKQVFHASVRKTWGPIAGFRVTVREVAG